MEGFGAFLLVPRGVSDSPAPGEPVTAREKPGDGGTLPGAAAKPLSSPAPPSRPLSRVLLRGSWARGAGRKFKLVLLLKH